MTTLNPSAARAVPAHGLAAWTHKLRKDLHQYRCIYLMLIPVLAWYICFCYVPMYGVQIAFKNFAPGLGIINSPWVGIYHLRSFFNSPYCFRLIRNTLLLSLYSIIFSFPASIILALMLNEVNCTPFKRTVQTISYLPHFISVVVLCGIIREFTNNGGLINNIVVALGGSSKSMLGIPSLFRPIYIISEIWQGVGWGSIIYLAALSGIDPSLYDAATVDGAGRFRRIWHITLPGILPTIVIMFILRIGSFMNIGWEKIILLYNDATMSTADVISSFVYRKGLVEQSYSYSAAVGLFNSLVNFILVSLANGVSRRFGETSLW